MRSLLIRSLVLLGLAALCPPAASAQVISVDPLTFDFGRMQQNEDRTTTVTIANQGAGLLEITEVTADCGCTVPTLALDQLAPGEATTVELKFNSKKFSGKVIKMVHIHSNDPQNPVVDIMLLADVFAPLLVDPPSERIGFERSQRGKVVTKEVTFTATEVPDLEIQAEETRQGRFDLAVIDGVGGDPKVCTLRISIPADASPGQVRDMVRVTTNVPERPYIDVNIRGWIVERLGASPERVTFRYKQSFKQDIRIAPIEKGITYKVTGAELDLPGVTVEVDETVPNLETYVRLRGEPVAKEDPRAIQAGGKMEGLLIIHTDLKDVPRFEIPVSYLIRM